MIHSFNDLKDKVCLITGGAGVIGSAMVEALAGVGVKTAVLGLNQAECDKVAQTISDKYQVKTIGIESNVLQKDSLEKALEITHKELGTIDLLINCAGGNSPKATAQHEFLTPDLHADLQGTFYDLDLEGFKFVFDLNFMGTLLPTMVFSKDMLRAEGGVILNISSMNAFRPLTKIPAYSAAKAAINNFTEWLAVHFAKSNVRVNAIAPGFFLTQQNRFLLVDEATETLTPRGQKIIDGTPMGEFGKPEDLQGTVLYLLSNISRFVTGVVIPVDGGFNAYSGV